jgi:hypothetical protein
MGEHKITSRELELERRVSRLLGVIDELNRSLERRTRQVDAMGWVWCDGGCRGMYRYGDSQLSEQMVCLAERNVQRMRTKLSAAERQREYGQTDRAASLLVEQGDAI